MAVVAAAVWNGQPASQVGVSMAECQRHGGKHEADDAGAEDVAADKLVYNLSVTSAWFPKLEVSAL